ncbi:hypothetical protein FSP39_018237 [Pinctada imbricata]|uniref:BIG2 domain-containing protein n=1 Tax=Pinctada imbricata TaxID=66713 RepID=A0AA89C292_PINIB|nr:hypothetical protein FSP39_018237 [Pinctada imbricata]
MTTVTGELLKCIVIVEAIHKFEIQTTTRLLYLEDSPEELIIQGYDEEGNVFSSLAGMEFKWSLLPDTTAEQNEISEILRIIKFTESHYTTPRHIRHLENKGTQGDAILVEGMRTGSAIVRAKARDYAYKDVAAPQVRIMVVANLMIVPAEAHVLKYADIKYKVQLLKHSSIIEIAMPSNQFSLEVQDGQICSLEAKTSIATAKELGSTEIVLNDKNLKQDSLIKPSAMLYVVSASYLGFVVLPHKKWVLETGREYVVKIDVYDKDSHRIYPSDNVILRGVFPKEYFDVKFSTPNGTHHRVYTLQKGTTNIDGSLVSVIREDGSEYPIKPVVRGSRKVEIYDPIKVHPELLFFPWDPEVPVSHQYQLKATGGSGEYVWSSTDVGVAGVNLKGEITTGKKGHTNVTAADTKNRAHTGTAMVHVLPPKDMEFKPKRVEAPVGTYLELPLAVYAEYKGKLHAFTNCRNMRLNVSFSDSSVFEKQTGEYALPQEGCRVLKVKAIQQGHTKVTVSYSVRGVDLSASVTIAAYDPLEPIDPEKESVIAVGSMKELVFHGGPQPWVLDTSQYIRLCKMFLLVWLTWFMIDITGGYHTFHVTCRDFGEQTLTLKVGNGKTATNRYPAVEVASIRLSCSPPVGLHLEPDVKYPEGLPPCPVTKDQSRPVPIHCNRDLDILVFVTDSFGKKFDNFSSLDIDWSVSDQSYGSLLKADSTQLIIRTVDGSKVAIKNYRTLHPLGRPGNIILSAAISRYNDKYLRLADSSISVRMDTQCWSGYFNLSPDIFMSDLLNNFIHLQVRMDIQRGSGYFHLSPEKTGVISLEYYEKTKHIQMLPLLDGSLTITVYDLCIFLPHPPAATVYVSGVGSIELYVKEKIEVENEAEARVRVMDAHGKPLQASFFSLMNLKVIPASNIVAVRANPEGGRDQFTAYYTVYGAQVGHTTLTVEARPRSGVVVRSQAKPVEVFPPLQLIPRNITLIIGALFQVLSKGGPTPQCTVLFSINDRRISTVSSSGLLDALNLGTTRVIGQAVGQDSETGETVVYSQDEATVNVVELTGIRIHAALKRMQTGTQMPVYVTGMSEHETPFTFGSSIPPLTFTWSVNNKDVVSLQNVFHKSNLKHHPMSDFAAQLVAKEPGHVTVKVSVEPKRWQKTQIQGARILTDEIQVEVFEKLAVVSPAVCDGKVLLSPHTEATIRTNRDGSAKMFYTIASQSSDDPIVNVGSTGVLTTSSMTGQATLQITSQEEFGANQTLVLLIKVKPVAYLMINSESQLRTQSGSMHTLPVGSTIHLKVTYHDDVGEQFYATNVKMRYRCSRYDLIQISHGLENNTLILKTAEVGQTILKVWDKSNPWLADYIDIPVDYAISPSKLTVTTGEIACFQSPLISGKGDTGNWYSTHKNFRIDKRKGIAVATGVGKSYVIHNLTSDVSTYTQVVINPIQELKIERSVAFMTNAEGNNPAYFIPVLFGDDTEIYGNNCSSVIKDEGYNPDILPFRCHLEISTQDTDIVISDLLTAYPKFDSNIGKYGCHVRKVMSSPKLQQISTLNTNIILKANVPAQEGQSEVTLSPVVFPFLPAFYVHNAEVSLTTISPLTTIRVSSVPDLASCIQAVVSDENILESMTPEKDSQSGNILIYPIRLLETAILWEKEKLESSVDLICQKTGQQVTLPVSIRLIGTKPDYLDYRNKYIGWGSFFRNIWNNYPSWLFILFLIITTAMAVILGYHFIFGSRNRMATNVNPAFLNSSNPMVPGAGTPPPPFNPGEGGNNFIKDLSLIKCLFVYIHLKENYVKENYVNCFYTCIFNYTGKKYDCLILSVYENKHVHVPYMYMIIQNDKILSK